MTRQWASADELAVRDAVRACIADLDEGALVLVACSGGPDSVALAAAAAFVLPRLGLCGGVVLVDHGLQAGSARVVTDAARWARGLGLEAVVRRVEVGAGGGPEAAARTARYAAIDAVVTETGAAAVLLGHTRDDQAETVLLGLARGSGTRSLAGMPAARGPYRRPLLHLPRATVRAALPPDAPVWDDPHNAEPAYARARVRYDALPVLETALGPGVAAALARTADQCRDDADLLDTLADEAYAALTPEICEHGRTGVSAADLAALPPALRRRVLLRLARVTLTAAHLAAVDALVTAWHGQGPVALPGPVEARRCCGRLCLADTGGC